MRYTFMSDGYAAVNNDVCYEDQNEDYCGDAIDCGSVWDWRLGNPYAGDKK